MPMRRISHTFVSVSRGSQRTEPAGLSSITAKSRRHGISFYLFSIFTVAAGAGRNFVGPALAGQIGD
jgi:hypothetical protein